MLGKNRGLHHGAKNYYPSDHRKFSPKSMGLVASMDKLSRFGVLHSEQKALKAPRTAMIVPQRETVLASRAVDEPTFQNPLPVFLDFS